MLLLGLLRLIEFAGVGPCAACIDGHCFCIAAVVYTLFLADLFFLFLAARLVESRRWW